MKIISLPRRWGKTRSLLQWMREAPKDEIRIGVFHSRERTMQVLREVARDQDGTPTARPLLQSWQFVSVSELSDPGLWAAVRKARPSGPFVLGLDELDLILHMLIHFEIGVATLTPDGM